MSVLLSAPDMSTAVPLFAFSSTYVPGVHTLLGGVSESEPEETAVASLASAR